MIINQSALLLLLKIHKVLFLAMVTINGWVWFLLLVFVGLVVLVVRNLWYVGTVYRMGRKERRLLFLVVKGKNWIFFDNKGIHPCTQWLNMN